MPTDLRDQDDGDDAGDEVVDIGVEADHVVVDGHEEDGREEEDGQVGQLLGQEVHVCPVGAGAVLAYKHGDLDTEGLQFFDDEASKLSGMMRFYMYRVSYLLLDLGCDVFSVSP